DLDELAGVVDGLAGDHDLRDIALAALALAHDASAPGQDDQVEIPDARRVERGQRSDRPERSERPRRDQNGTFDERARDNAEPTGFLHISIGRRAGVRPGDLVGAIANEVDLPGRQIGPIRIADQYSV